mmetsp:Transcript_2859/g.5989  ORF Transcript_2859/g.5989 Transcript_2859/m.5989 type:complete len:81 (+) Transcript_2859:1280-1522(+)
MELTNPRTIAKIIWPLSTRVNRNRRHWSSKLEKYRIVLYRIVGTRMVHRGHKDTYRIAENKNLKADESAQCIHRRSSELI